MIEADSKSEGGLLLHIKSKRGWRQVEVGRGSQPDTLPYQHTRSLAAVGSDCPWYALPAVSMRDGGVGPQPT